VSARIQLYVDGEPAQHITLGELLMDPREPFGTGKSTEIVVRNEGDTVLRDVSVHIGGEASSFVLLSDAADVEVFPGAPVSHEETMYPGDEFSVWAKPIYNATDAEGNKNFEMVIRARSG